MLLCVQYILHLHPSWKREPFPVDTDVSPPPLFVCLSYICLYYKALTFVIFGCINKLDK